MVKVIFKGPETNLGRFEVVRNGDILNLTDQEWSTVTKDKRFAVVKDDKVRAPDRLIKITPQMTGKEREEAERKNKEELDRLAQLEKANDSDQVEVLEIRSKSMDDLTRMAEQINEREGRIVIDPNRGSKAHLIRSILNHRRTSRGLPPELVEDESEKE
jgi:alpha-L-fucosidase